MFGNIQVCSLCALECGVKGCIISGNIQVIGSNCLAHLIKESQVQHTFVDLDLALRMQGNPSLIKYYLKELSKSNRAISFLAKNSETIEECKILFRDSKESLILI